MRQGFNLEGVLAVNFGTVFAYRVNGSRGWMKAAHEDVSRAEAAQR